MKKTYIVTFEDAQKARELMKNQAKRNVYQRLEIIALLGEGKTPVQVADIMKRDAKNIRTLANLFTSVGIDEYAKDKRKGGNHRLMSKDEATEFLGQFEEIAEKGQIVTVAEMSAALDELTQKEHKSQSTIYNFLHTNGWRKVMPRSKHPKKASNEAIAASKKLTQLTEK